MTMIPLTLSHEKWRKLAELTDLRVSAHLRRGQAHMVALATIDIDAYSRVFGSSFDCYHDDRLLPRLLERLEAIWGPRL